jgi:hypothetical protein
LAARVIEQFRVFRLAIGRVQQSRALIRRLRVGRVAGDVEQVVAIHVLLWNKKHNE